MCIIIVIILVIFILAQYMSEVSIDIKDGGGGYLKNIYLQHKGKQYITIEDEPKLKMFFMRGDISRDYWFTPRSVYETTPRSTSRKILKFMKNCIGNLANLTLTDASSSVGGDILTFSDAFLHVNANEYDRITYDALIHNITLYNKKNIDTFNEDYGRIYNKLSQDVVYMDPPWGGPEYKNNSCDELKYGEINIIDIIKGLPKCHIIIKAPYNYNINEIKSLQRFNRTLTIKKILLIHLRPVD